MTNRATITEAELRRAVRVADALGKVVRVTRGGAWIVDPKDMPAIDDSPPEPKQAEAW